MRLSLPVRKRPGEATARQVSWDAKAKGIIVGRGEGLDLRLQSTALTGCYYWVRSWEAGRVCESGMEPGWHDQCPRPHIALEVGSLGAQSTSATPSLQKHPRYI